jgi:predicted dehydrogenase
MDKIRWGVLSTAKIAREKVIPATQASSFGVVTAIASRDVSRARSLASQLSIEMAYGSYEALLAADDVDAVYIPLPNHLHVPWALRAIESGKHVLCEKPIALCVAETEQLVEAADSHPRLKVMEAFMYRFHPQWQLARRLVREGRIGELRTIHTDFSYFNNDPQNIRESQVDCLTSAILEFEAGTSTFTCGTQHAPYQRVNLFGTTGRVEIEIPFNAPPDRPCRVWLQSSGPLGDNVEEIQLEVCNQYTLQADAFARSVLDDQPVPTPLDDAVANMRVIERIFDSAETSSWE